jgi:hypothetical protein
MVVRIEASGRLHARKVLGWPKRCKLAHAFLWEHSYKRLKLGQLLGQLCIFLALRGWEKQVLSARGFKRVGRHSEYAI